MIDGTSARTAAAAPLARLRPGPLAALSPARGVLALIVVSGLVRLIFAGLLGLGVDETYTVGIARTFSLSYVDHPPLHLWLVGGFAKLVHSEHPLVVRLPFVLMFAGATWAMFRLTALLFGERAGLWAALALNLAPHITFAAASWVVPDGAVNFFLLCGATVVARLLFAQGAPSPTLGSWLIAGTLCGLAMLSKFQGVFLLVGTFLTLLTWREGRTILLRPGPWLAALVAALVFSPVIVWNIKNGASGIAFQASRAAWTGEINITRMLGNIGGQAGYLLPWLFVPLIVVLARALRAGSRAPRTWFCALLAIGPILFFTGASLLQPGLPHWSMQGWLFAMPLFGAAMVEREALWAPWPQRIAAGTAALLVAILTVFTVQAQTGLLFQAPADRSQRDPTLEMFDWSEIASALSARGLIGGDVAAVAGAHWIDAGRLNYALGGSEPVLCICDDPHHFRFVHDPAAFAGRTIVVVGQIGLLNPRRAYVERHFAAVENLPPVFLHRASRQVIQLEVMRGTGFKP